MDWHNAGDKPFDVWLRHQLGAKHDPVLKERLPEEWLALLGGARDRERGNHG